MTDTEIFSMAIDDTFFIESRGPVITGTVKSGFLQVGDEIEIVTQGGQHISTSVIEIESFHKKIVMAGPGQQIAVFLRNQNITKDLLRSCYGGLVYEAGAVPAQPAEPGSSKRAILTQSDSTPKQGLTDSEWGRPAPAVKLNQQDPKGILVRGLFRVDLGHLGLGQQEIHITILKGLKHCPEDDILNQWAQIAKVEPRSEKIRLWEHRANERVKGYVFKSISESGARHILIAGVSAPSVFSKVHSDFISLPNDKYSFTFRDVPSGRLKVETLREFAELRRRKPDQNHILACTTSPLTAPDCGIFDQLPQASDGAAVYVIGYGSRLSNLIANFYRCVNVPGKAKGFVHSIVSLDTPTITNEEFDRLHAIENPVEKLQFFWDMAGRQFGPTKLENVVVPLLGITVAADVRVSDNQNGVHKITIHKFDESRRLAQRDPARLQETRGQLLSVKCRFCGETFVVGENAVVVTDEDIDWRGSRQPDVIMPVVPTDRAAASAEGASVLSAIRRGEERTWCCEKCHNQTPQPYPEMRYQELAQD